METLSILLKSAAVIWLIAGLIMPSYLKDFLGDRKTAIVCAIFFFALGWIVSPSDDTNKQEPTQTKQEQSIDTHDYINFSRELIKNLYVQAGQAEPKVDMSVMNYKEWESSPGLIETQGTYTLSTENDKIEHNYSIRYGKNSYDVIRVSIDGQRLMWNEELQDKYTEQYNK